MTKVSNVYSTLRRTSIPAPPEEITSKKEKMISLVDKALQKFSENLADGKVELKSSLDLERLIKLSLLLSGEAESIIGVPSKEEQTISADLELDPNDTKVQELYAYIFDKYNKKNDLG